MSDRNIVPLLELDPDLGLLLSDDDRVEAARRELRVSVHTIDAGPWDADKLAWPAPDTSACSWSTACSPAKSWCRTR